MIAWSLRGEVLTNPPYVRLAYITVIVALAPIAIHAPPSQVVCQVF